MTIRTPLVIYDGLVSDLREGDTVNVGVSTTTLLGVSGLAGGDLLSSNPRIDTQLLPNASGIIFVGDALGLDGVAQVTSETALASGNAAAVLASNALASGNNSLVVATAALASGNAALTELDGFVLASSDIRVEASAAVASGMPVGFDDAGKVAPVVSLRYAGNADPMKFGTPGVVFGSGNIVTPVSVYDSFNKKVVIFYRDAIVTRSYAVVGAVENDTVSFGTPVQLSTDNTTPYDAVFDPDTKQIILFYSNVTTTQGECVVGSVSGSTFNFGTPVTVQAANTQVGAVTYASNSSRVVFIYEDAATGSVRARVGTVSNLSVSLGADTLLSATPTNSAVLNATYDTANQLVAYTVDNASTNVLLGTASVAGTTITPENQTVLFTGNGLVPNIIYAPLQELIVGCYEVGSTNFLGFTADLSGGTITVNPTTQITTSNVGLNTLTYDSLASRVVLSYDDVTIASGTTVVLEPSGTTVNVSSPAYFGDAAYYAHGSCYDSFNNRVLIAVRDNSTSNLSGVAYVASGLVDLEVRPLLAGKNNYLGISQSTVASGSECLVNLPGKQYFDPSASFAKGSFYYLDTFASGLTTDSTEPTSWSGDVPYTYVGKATSTSGLLLLDCL